EQPFERKLCLMRVDFLTETACSAKCEPEELELVGRRPRAIGKQLQALLAHLGIGLVREQLDTIVERPDGGHEIVSEPRAEKAGKIHWVHRKALMGQSFRPCKLPR